MTESCFLVLDQGGQSSRALVIDQAGEVLAHDSVAVATQTPETGFVEQDAEQLVDSLRQVAECVVKQLTPLQTQALYSAVLVSQRSSMICWERDSLKPVSAVISWQDCRARNWLKQQKVDYHWFRRRTGLYLNAHLGASKMHWCLNEHQAVQEAFSAGNLMMGPLAAYLAARLTNTVSVKVDPANAQRTGLYNIEKHGWDDALLRLFDIPRSLLPEIVSTCDDYGSISLSDFKLPLQILNGDQSAAIFSDGEPNEDVAYINVGTGAFITALWHGTTMPEQLLNSVVFKTGEAHYVVEGTVNGAGSAINWAEEQGLLDNQGNGFDRLQSGNQELLFMNGVGGLGSPYWQPQLVSGFIGEGNKQQKLQAIEESILFLLQSNLQVMQNYGLHLQRVVISGGLSCNDDLCQALADLVNLPVWRPDEVEASARGAAYLLAREYNRTMGIESPWSELGGREFLPQHDHHLELHQRFYRWQHALQKTLTEPVAQV